MRMVSKKNTKVLGQYQCKYSPVKFGRHVISDILLGRQFCLVNRSAPSRATSLISNCRGIRDGKTAARPHRGVPSLRDTQPHAPGVFSIYYQEKKGKTSKSAQTLKGEGNERTRTRRDQRR